MQLTQTSALKPASTARASRSSRTAVRVWAHLQEDDKKLDRRAAVGLLLAAPTLFAGTAFAKTEADDRKKELFKTPAAAEGGTGQRKEALKETAAEVRKTGEPKQTFDEAKYGPADDRLGGSRARQEEGLKQG